MKIRKLQYKFFEQKNFSTLFWIAIKSILRSKAYWGFIFAIIVVFLITKSLNLINSIHEGATLASRAGVAYRFDSQPIINPSNQLLDSWSKYVFDSFSYSLNMKYLRQLEKMQVFYNFIVISLIVLVANITLFKKIKSGSILLYLSTPTNKVRIMIASILASFTMALGSFIILHAADTIITYVIFTSYDESSLKSIFDKEYARMVKTTSKLDSIIVAKIVKNVMASKPAIEYLNFFLLLLFSSFLYILILIGISFILLLFLNASKTIAILSIYGIALNMISLIIASTVDNPEEILLVFKWLFFPSLINDLVVVFLMDYAGFDINIKWERSLLTKTIFSSNWAFFYKGGSTSIFKDDKFGVLWVNRDILYIILPITAVILPALLPIFHKRADWK